MRLIDADALTGYVQELYEYDLSHDDDYTAGRASAEHGVLEKIRELPTIDAIPVEWLEHKRKCSDPESVRDINGVFVSICIDGVLVLWQKEQEENNEHV